MRAPLRAALVAAAIAASLVAASSALAANTATIAVSSAGTATTIHINVPQTTDPIAAISIYVPAGYTADLSAAPNTNIGTVDATANGHDVGLTLPLTGLVTTDNPASHTSDACSPGHPCGRVEPEPQRRRAVDTRAAAVRRPDGRRRDRARCVPDAHLPAAVGRPRRHAWTLLRGRPAPRRGVHGEGHLHRTDERRPARVAHVVHALHPRRGHAEPRGHLRGARPRRIGRRSR